MNDSRHLAFSTQHSEVDARIGAFLHRVEQVFPLRLRAAYLTGSWRDGSAVSRSDIDIVVVFYGLTSLQEAETFVRLVRDFNADGGLEVGPWGMDDDELSKPIPAYLKAAVLLCGEEVLASLPLLSPQEVLRRWTLGSLKLMQLLRADKQHLRPVLTAPDETLPSLGYRFRQGDNTTSSKLFVSTVARIAGARAAEMGVQLPSKKACCLRYRELVGDSYSDFVEDTFHILKEQWEYGIPTDKNSSQTLRRLCQTFLAMENDFLKRVRLWHNQALSSPEREEHNWAKQCAARVDFSWGQGDV